MRSATVREVAEAEDGEYDLITVGTDRLQAAAGVDEWQPSLCGEVELLPNEAGDAAVAALAVRTVPGAFPPYLNTLADRGGATISVCLTCRAGPCCSCTWCASSIVVDLPVRQDLLAQPDAAHRLAVERSLLAQGDRHAPGAAAPTQAPDLRSSPYSPN